MKCLEIIGLDQKGARQSIYVLLMILSDSCDSRNLNRNEVVFPETSYGVVNKAGSTGVFAFDLVGSDEEAVCDHPMELLQTETYFPLRPSWNSRSL